MFARRGSIAAAAQELGVSPSAVSQRVRPWSGRRNCRCSNAPRTRRASPTPAETWSARHHDPGGCRGRGEPDAGWSGTIAGPVRVSFIPGLAATAAPDLAELQRRHPEFNVVALQIESTAASAALLDRATDIAVVDEWGEETVGPSERCGPSARTAKRSCSPCRLSTPWRSVTSRSRCRRRRCARLVRTETWLSSPPGQVSRLAGDARLADLGVTPGRRWEFDGLYVLARLVAVGSGITLLPSSVAAYERRVAGIPLQPRMYRYVRVLTRTSSRGDPKIDACLEAIRQGLRRPSTEPLTASPFRH